MVLTRIFGPKRDDVTGEWRKLHNEELNDRYSSPNVFLMIKWRRMRWAGRVVRMEKSRDVYRVLVGKSEGDPRLDGRVILIWIFRKLDVGAWTVSSWLRRGTGSGHL